jgi:hypothetical protein
MELNLQLGRFAIKITAHKEPGNDEESQFGIEPTYEEDAPFLPKNLLEFLEKDSVRLGVKSEALKFDDLEMIRHKELNTQKEEDTHSGIMAPQHSQTMNNFNTMRETELITQQNLPLQQTTIARRRNSQLLENTIEEVQEDLQNMELPDDDHGLPAPRPNLNTENDTETDNHNMATSSRFRLHTDLGKFNVTSWNWIRR